MSSNADKPNAEIEQGALRLRAATRADIPFLRDLNERAYRDVVMRQFGRWDEDEQRGWFEKKLDELPFEIIQLHGAPVGVVATLELVAHVQLRELQVAPEHQNAGVGSAVLKLKLDRARELDKPLRLRVLHQNRARVLYERHGLAVINETETHYVMEIEAHD